jgi:hypothetical protein
MNCQTHVPSIFGIGFNVTFIRFIWAQVKGFVAKNNTTFRLKDVKELTYVAFGKITKDV